MDYQAKDYSTMKLMVFDANGQQYAVKIVNTQQGNQRVAIDITTLLKGTYFLSLEGADYKATRRFVVVK